MQSKRVTRLLKLLQLLQSGEPLTVEEMGERVGVSRRTAFRDLSLLGDAGLRFEYDRDTKRYSASKHSLLPPVTLSHGEALTLMMAVRYVLERPWCVDRAVASSAALKLQSMLPSALVDYCWRMLGGVEVSRGQVSDSTGIVDTLSLLQSAVADGQRIRVRYDSYYEGKAIDDTLVPYRVVFRHRGWYVIARSARDDRVQMYKVERILHVAVLAGGGGGDAEFDLDMYFGNAWLMIRGDTRYHVRIRFSAKVAGNVDEVVWHKTQQTTFEEGGSLLFEVDVDGLGEIMWWVLGYGDQATVLEPAELRGMILGHAEAMRDVYGGKE